LRYAGEQLVGGDWRGHLGRQNTRDGKMCGEMNISNENKNIFSPQRILNN
jgi:hypothetical protein